MKWNIKTAEKWELKHKVIFFIFVLAATLLINRLLFLIKDTDVIIKGVEIHHVTYGIILIIIVNLLMLFSRTSFHLCLILSAIGIGTAIDEVWYILQSIQANPEQYTSSWPSAVLFAGVVICIAILINYFSNRKKTSQK